MALIIDKNNTLTAIRDPILVDNEKRHKAGHNHSFTAMDGKDYITFHANPIDPNAKSIESFFIEPVEYTKDGNVIIKDW